MAGDRLRTAARGERGGAVPGGGEEALLAWAVHPLRTFRRRSLFLLLLPVAWVAFLRAGGPTALFLSVAFSLLAVSGYLLRTEYVLTREGVRVRNALTSEFRWWRDFACFREYPDAVQLLYRRRSLRDALLHGMVLFLAGNRDDVVAVVSQFVPREGGDTQGRGGRRGPAGEPRTRGDALRPPHPNGRVPVGQRLEAVAAGRPS